MSLLAIQSWTSHFLGLLHPRMAIQDFIGVTKRMFGKEKERIGHKLGGAAQREAVGSRDPKGKSLEETKSLMHEGFLVAAAGIQCSVDVHSTLWKYTPS
ncbi:uncharacterized protein EI90DRAFT_3046478 [Cantharellus anzutake]|uniref:uncharacterized protein n=1 Tax=Cantharellus anzutake TaxID=1750568 RepID=UPI0019075AED|nr:uncharacterized protein EI90DRAFT_3046478 [Cantharellus anzutake]KAF8336621.1 hypothetical protein EI90DRAFT_3046478 [Cantharellus anzutake]